MKTPGQILREVLADGNRALLDEPLDDFYIEAILDLEQVARRFISRLALAQTDFPLPDA